METEVGSMKSLDEFLRDAGRAHGHLCAGQVLGVRMAMLGMSKLGIEDPHGKDRKRLVTFVEIDRCVTDAVAVVTGCRLGKRALKFRDWGKVAATFVDVSTGKAIREYVWFGSTPIAVFTPDPANAANPPLIYFIHTDHIDTPRVIVDKNNAIRWRWMAEPFGVNAPETNPSNLGTFTFNLRFPGQYARCWYCGHHNVWGANGIYERMFLYAKKAGSNPQAAR